jgi:hypothetical protein
MTFGAAMRELMRRAWAVAVVAVIVGACAYLVASRHHASYQASAVVAHKPVKVKRGPHGLKRLVLEPAPALATGTDYLRAPTGMSLVSNGKTTVMVLATGRTQAAAGAAATSYLNRLRQHWTSQFTTAQSRTLSAIQARSGNGRVTRSDIAQAIAATKAVKPSISIGAVAVKQTSAPFSAVTAAILGAISGALLGIGLILGIYALRGQIWSAEELAPLGVELVELDSGGEADLHRLRVELEARGLGAGLQSVVVLSAGSADRWTPVARALAESFRGTGADTVLISAVPRGKGREPGVAEFLADPTHPLNLRRVADHLLLVPAGAVTPRDRHLTAQRIGALVNEASRHGVVTVIDAPPIDSPVSSLLVAAVDCCVVVAHRRHSTAGALTAAVVRARRLAARDPILCFDKADAGRSGRRSAAPELDRSQHPSDVPANANL